MQERFKIGKESFTQTKYKLMLYLLMKLGFKKDDFFGEYINFIINNYSKYKNIGNLKKIEIEYDGQKVSLPQNFNPRKRYIDMGNYYKPEHFSILDFLTSEIRIKQEREFSKKQILFDYVTASDISNFTYCPVSYSISKSIDYKLLLESTEIGLIEHESSIIHNYFKSKNFVTEHQESIDSKLTKSYHELSEILSKSELIYSGHNVENRIKYFKSKSGKYIGQPDFILRKKDTNEYFIIEEKFQRVPREFVNYRNQGDEYFDNLEIDIIKKRNSDYFYNNHVNQIYSYIYGISDFNIISGILIYWKYEVTNGKPEIHSCNLKILEKNQTKKEELNQMYQKILQFSKTGLLDFNPNNRNPSKCASCVNNFLCGHKTGNFSEINLPYNLNHLNIYNADFPDELKKKKRDYDEHRDEFNPINFQINNIIFPEKENDENIDESLAF